MGSQNSGRNQIEGSKNQIHPPNHRRQFGIIAEIDGVEDLPEIVKLEVRGRVVSIFLCLNAPENHLELIGVAVERPAGGLRLETDEEAGCVDDFPSKDRKEDGRSSPEKADDLSGDVVAQSHVLYQTSGESRNHTERNT